jgi:hypothetical protein
LPADCGHVCVTEVPWLDVVGDSIFSRWQANSYYRLTAECGLVRVTATSKLTRAIAHTETFILIILFASEPLLFRSLRPHDNLLLS